MRWLGVVLLVLLTVPATATAARVELRPGTLAGENELAYTAGADEVNDVHISRQSGQPTGAVWTISDPEAPPTERVPPCYAGTFGGSGGPGSTCPDDHVASIFVDLGDRDDAGPVDHGFTRIYIPVRLYGGPGRDRLDMHSEGGNLLDGGPGDDVIVSERQEGFFGPDFRGGADTVSGGEGNDMIRSRDLQRDVISCGPGHDEAVVDSLDAVDADCENVVRPYPPPPPTDSWVRADGRPVGVTINGSAKYTNSPDVVLTVLGPPHANSLLISNDGSFSSWDGRLVRDSERYRFRLESSGPDRLPKTVYVRFDIPVAHVHR
jgi:Ca2+-binding RTX toxin-like protein